MWIDSPYLDNVLPLSYYQSLNFHSPITKASIQMTFDTPTTCASHNCLNLDKEDVLVEMSFKCSSIM